MSDLKPCPHCGKTETLEFATRRENEDCPNFDDCDAEKCKYGACDYFSNWDCVVCSVIKSGCGATGGYASCPAEAVEKWNTRAERTCHITTLGLPLSDFPIGKCSNCGCGADVSSKYCWQCGAKVVGND